jgi:MFS family permease
MLSLRASRVLVSLFALELGSSVSGVGLLVACYALFPLLLAVFAGKLSDRLGVRLPMLFGAAGMACGMLMPFLLPSLTGLFVSAALIGASNIFFSVSIQHWIGMLGGVAERTKNFSNYSLAVSVGGFLGPMAAGFGIDSFGHARAYLLCAAVPLVPFVIMAFVARGLPHPPARENKASTESILELWRNPGLRRIMLTGGALLTGIDLFEFYMPVYCRGVGLSASAIGMVVAMYSLAAFSVRVAIPALAKWKGEEALLTYAMVLGALAYIAVPFFRDPWLLGAICFALGLCLGTGQPLSMTITYNRSPAGRSGEALGLRLTINNVTHTAVPLVFGALGAALGLSPVFWITAALLASGAWFSRDFPVP